MKVSEATKICGLFVLAVLGVLAIIGILMLMNKLSGSTTTTQPGGVLNFPTPSGGTQPAPSPGPSPFSPAPSPFTPSPGSSPFTPAPVGPSPFAPAPATDNALKLRVDGLEERIKKLEAKP